MAIAAEQAGRHAGYSRSRPDSALTVVFTHGIMGSPRQFDEFVAFLDPSFSVENLLLPGHGATADDYAMFKMADWQRYLDDQVSKLAARQQKIILVGHSMGGLLSIKTALDYPDQVIGLFLIATPLRVGISRKFIGRSLSIAFSRRTSIAEIELARKTSSVTFPAWYSYLKGSTRVLELLGKIRQVRKLLPSIHCPVHFVFSRNDEIVDIRSASDVPATGNIKLTLLESSGHYVYTPSDNDRIRSEFMQFLAAAVENSSIKQLKRGDENGTD